MKEPSEKPGLRDRFYDLFPTLERGERKQLVERIAVGADGGVDFIMMMLLASTLASLGLLEGSTAVVIGAMLVAPLMGPLLAAGFALTQGNLRLFRDAIAVCGLGIIIGLGASLFFGALNPGFEPSMEIEARGDPDVLDLIIALASGMVAAYAMGRPNVAGTLAGVAIAAALLPPLAVIGIGLTNDRLFVAGNAAILFATNLVAIILGASLVFRLLGLHVAVGGTAAPRWVRRVTLTLALLAVILAMPLLINVLEKSRSGQMRPANYPVSVDVRRAVRRYLEDHPSLRMIEIARQSIAPEAGITVVLTTAGALPVGIKDELKHVIRSARGNANAIVRVFILLEAPEILPPETP
ncbi:MAG TPA: hypothetical protein DCO71_11660 [Gammaproteobacteria bacterium]|nr:hypothetical protein [Gammaproteobacteria bacterium]